MNHVPQLLSAHEWGDPHAASRLLPLAYQELSKPNKHERPRSKAIAANR
jgi:hypothetical protein